MDGDASSADEVSFISVSGNFRQYISYNNSFLFNLSQDYWYFGGGEYQKNAVGGDWIDVGGHCLFGVLNGWYANQTDAFSNSQFYYQLVVSDITSSPNTDSLSEGLLFASRHSENDDILSGMGYGVGGMLSPFAYETGDVVLGPNALAANRNQICDVVFSKSSDKKIQVYALGMNLGILAFEITYY